MDFLAIIPARAGSKGISKKNTRQLAGKPLVQYTIEAAKRVFEAENILISTDDDEVLKIGEKLGIVAPFKRPAELSSDTASMRDVLLHALQQLEEMGKKPSVLVLLQPTSPFRTDVHIREAIKAYQNEEVDMVVSVTEVKANPYYNLFEENNRGYLEQSKKGNFVRRQDCPKVWEYNGALYIINVDSLKKRPLNKFDKIKKYIMSTDDSLDLDTMLDWMMAEMLLRERAGS